MKKEVTKKKVAVDVSRVKSIIGEKQYNEELITEIQSGTPMNEAHELIERRERRLQK